MDERHSPNNTPPRVTARPFLRSRAVTAAGLAGLLVLLAVHTAWAWRYFPMLLGDQGWYLQVAARVSQGEVLYRDVAWAYGPLPAQVLAALLRISGPDAGLATAINGLLAAASLLLTYRALRSLLQPGMALAFTAFAALAGPYVGGDLIRLHLLAYTQAVTWGMTLSLAALVAGLRWQQTGRWSWAVAAGGLVGLAGLSKPEFGLSAAGTVLALLIAGRAPRRAWATCLAAAGLVMAAGFSWQASTSGWQPLWRGVLGYDMVSQGRFWGAAAGSRRWLGSLVCAWLAVAVLWAGGRRRRVLAAGAAAVLAALAFALMAPVLLENDPAGTSSLGLTAGRILQWLAAVPWAPLTLVLLVAAWPARRRHAPPAWWGLWAFATLSNLRLLLTGYSLGLAVAPALAVLWWLLVAGRAGRAAGEVTGARPGALRWALVALAALAVVNLAGQALTPGVALTTPRRWLHTTLGPVAVLESRLTAEMTSIQAELAQRIPAGAPIFATGWGPGWYLLSGRDNPTAFDAVLRGLGTSGPEAQVLQDALHQQPPAAVLVPVEQWLPAPPGVPRGRDLDAAAVREGLASWWNGLDAAYTPAPFSDRASWVVLWRR